MCVYVYIYICITSLYNEVYTTKSLHYIIGINNIVNQLYLNKNKKKRKEKKQTGKHISLMSRVQLSIISLLPVTYDTSISQKFKNSKQL